MHSDSDSHHVPRSDGWYGRKRGSARNVKYVAVCIAGRIVGALLGEIHGDPSCSCSVHTEEKRKDGTHLESDISAL